MDGRKLERGGMMRTVRSVGRVSGSCKSGLYHVAKFAGSEGGRVWVFEIYHQRSSGFISEFGVESLFW